MDIDKLIENADELAKYGAGLEDSSAGAIQQSQAFSLIAIAKLLRELVAENDLSFSTELHKRD